MMIFCKYLCLKKYLFEKWLKFWNLELVYINGRYWIYENNLSLDKFFG